MYYIYIYISHNMLIIIYKLYYFYIYILQYTSKYIHYIIYYIYIYISYDILINI